MGFIRRICGWIQSGSPKSFRDGLIWTASSMTNPTLGIFFRHLLLRPMIFASDNAKRYTDCAGKNGLRLCGDATWEGISRSIARQRCGQSRRVVTRRNCFSKAHWTQEPMPQKIHLQTEDDFQFWHLRSKIPCFAKLGAVAVPF